LFVILHLPPPLALIFAPIFGNFSSRRTFLLFFADVIEAKIPEAPAPITIKSYLLISF
jgi:hypothetical protein